MTKKTTNSVARAYKIVVSPILHQLLGGHVFGCRYYPTCSEYFKDAIEVHGIKGLYYGVKRILRCHPFSRGGFDPVIK